MNRILLAFALALFGVALLATPTHAAESNQRGAGKILRRDGERIRIVAELLDIEPRALLRALRGGRTVSDLAADANVPLADIKEALAQPYRDRIAREVADGVLTEAQAEHLLARADERLTDFLTLTPRRARLQPELEELAAVLGSSEADIIAQIEAGESLAEIVAASGKPVETVIAEMVALRDADLQERVALDLMTATQKNRILRVYEGMLTTRLGN